MPCTNLRHLASLWDKCRIRAREARLGGPANRPGLKEHVISDQMSNTRNRMEGKQAFAVRTISKLVSQLHWYALN